MLEWNFCGSRACVPGKPDVVSTSLEFLAVPLLFFQPGGFEISLDFSATLHRLVDKLQLLVIHDGIINVQRASAVAAATARGPA